MLLKIMNEDGQWEIWDGITHVTEKKLLATVVQPGPEEGDVPPGLQLEVALPSSDPKKVNWQPNGDEVDELLIDLENSSNYGLTVSGVARGTLLVTTMSDGKKRTFAFLSVGYLLSESGKTLEAYNKH